MAALLILRDRVLRPLMAAASAPEPTPQARNIAILDLHYAALHNEMHNLFTHLGIAA